MGGVPYMLTEQGVGALLSVSAFNPEIAPNFVYLAASTHASSSTSLESLALSSCSSCSLSSSEI